MLSSPIEFKCTRLELTDWKKNGHTTYVAHLFSLSDYIAPGLFVQVCDPGQYRLALTLVEYNGTNSWNPSESHPKPICKVRWFQGL